MSKAVEYFDNNARKLTEFYNGFERKVIHEELLNIIDNQKVLNILDIGAGSGADANMFASMGHSVLAVEPSQEMMLLAKNNFKNNNINWISDVLPELRSVVALNRKFDVIYSVAVLQFLNKEDRLSSLKTIFSLLADQGVVELQYPSAHSRELQFTIDENEVEDFVLAHGGLEILCQKSTRDLCGRQALDGSDLYIRKIIIRKQRA